MGRHKLREDKKCQNCGSFVRRRFCPKCGQENVDTRQSFHYLFTHFIEDLVHYDGSFWKTVKNLLFKPGVLTKEYLEGKRKKYVAPVKLYIFVSFFVFFVGGIISKITSEKTTYDDSGTFEDGKTTNYGIFTMTPPNAYNDSLIKTTGKENITTIPNKKVYDSIQAALPEHERDSGLSRIVNRKLAESEDKYTDKEFLKKFAEVFMSNFQKFLFFYMPVFAFFMWLFHSKNKWYYFDSGIFTLHYFSFLLLSFFVILSILGPLSNLPALQNWFFYTLFIIIYIILYLWIFIYFFKALRKVYGDSRINTFFRGMFLLFLNNIFFLFGIVVYFFLIFLIT